VNIYRLFSTKERIDILKYIIYLEREFGVIETAKKLKISKGLVSKYFRILIDEKIIKRKGTKFLVTNHSLVKGIRIMFNLQNIEPKLFKKYNFVKAAGLYGSCSKGSNTVNSDVDLWIMIDKASDEELSHFTSDLRKQNENLKILLLNKEKIDHMKKKDPLFYYSLYFGSIIIYGAEDEI